MGDPDGDGYLSIGEVLGLLLEEFPDVTISKIRFLESQGLISPERTSSGYRKFYDDDVELLRVILTEQRQNYLPLRVIKDRLETGQIDPTGEHLRPDDSEDGQPPVDEDAAGTADVPSSSVASHPAGRGRSDPAAPSADAGEHVETVAGDDADELDDADTDTSDSHPATAAEPDPPATPADATSSAQLLPGVLLDRGELCSVVGMTEAELDQLENFGVVQPADDGGTPVYDDNAVEIARPACEFLRAGIDARHLRTFRTSAEREASLYEQIITPRFRQRNPESRAEALTQLRRLDELGAKLRAALTKQALGPHLKS